jgi:acyl-CoA synthetase (AMP-forming)/AMP-acid ligase II
VQFWGVKDESVYLWTLPMFHCNGWGFIWGMAAVAGTNVIIRNVEIRAIYDCIVRHKVTHLCGAPVVLNMIASALPDERKALPQRVATYTGGAPPPPSVLSAMEEQGFSVLHSYGLTETYGPALVCTWKPEWDALPLQERARIKARQGVQHVGLQGVDVLDPGTMRPVARDGREIGEIMARGCTIMKGYFKDEEATRKAFEGGWFHTGDLGVVHPDGYMEVKDRSKDIIISGGENISSIEVEAVLFKHPDVLEAAVVAKPDERWGESPCAFVTLRANAKGNVTADTLIAYCRKHLPRYYVPKTVVFCELPKTSTGKVQKFKLRETAKALITSSHSEFTAVSRL